MVEDTAETPFSYPKTRQGEVSPSVLRAPLVSARLADQRRNQPNTHMNTEKVSKKFWDDIYKNLNNEEKKLSSWYISNRNTKTLLTAAAKRCHTVMEIGSAPGAWLAWIHQNSLSRVTGLDYSETGIEKQKKYFIKLGIDGESVCEDILSYTGSENIFDLVYSLGVIEHHDDPSLMIQAHLRLAKPGGLVLIAIPNYSGKYLTLQSIFDSENLKIHNLNLMSKVALERCAPKAGISDLRVFPFGRLDPGLINLNNRLPSAVTKPLFHFATLLSHLIPEKLHLAHAMWVMSFRKSLV